MKKGLLILFYLCLLLGIGTTREVFGFNPYCSPTLTVPADDGEIILGDCCGTTTLRWNDNCDALSYTVRYWGPAFNETECVDKTAYGTKLEDVHIWAASLQRCKYHWKVRGWMWAHCEENDKNHESGVLTKTDWSEQWTFYIATTSSTMDLKCAPTPETGEGFGLESIAVDSCKLNYDFTDIDDECEEDAEVSQRDTIRWGTCCFLNSLYKISDILIVLIAPFAILIFLYAGFQFMTSSGDPEKLKSVQGLMLYAGIGLFIAVLAKAIVFAIKSIV